MICSNCGKVYKDKLDACPRCGMPNGAVAENEATRIESSRPEQSSRKIENVSEGFRPLDTENLPGAENTVTVESEWQTGPAKDGNSSVMNVTVTDADGKKTVKTVSGAVDELNEKFREAVADAVGKSGADPEKVEEVLDKLGVGGIAAGADQAPASQAVPNDNAKDYTGRPDIGNLTKNKGCGSLIAVFIMNDLFFCLPGFIFYFTTRGVDKEYSRKLLIMTLIQLVLNVGVVILALKLK